MFFGALSIVTGRGLRRRRGGSRALALGVGVANLLVLPLGTALGVYTFWVLLNNDARREFGLRTVVKS